MKKEDFSKVKVLLDISDKDLDSSEILFNSKNYSNAVFSLQQSVEKSMKAHSTINEVVPFEKLKDKIGHNPLKVYAKSANENLSKSKNLNKAFQIKPELKKNPLFKDLKLNEFEAGNKRVIDIISQIDKGGKIFSEDIDELKDAIKEMKKLIKENLESNKKIEINKDLIKKIKQSWIEGSRPFVKIGRERGEQISENWESEIESISDKDIKKMVKNIYSLFVLGGVSHTLNFMLNLFLKPHFELVRYPDIKNPLEYYNKKNPLIIKFKQLLEIQKSNLKVHRDYLKFIQKLENQPKPKI